jgi:putative transposase
MTKPEPLQYGQTYHIYNRGNNGENLFREERNYPSRAFSNLFATYTKASNKTYQHTGSLFEKPFRRKWVTCDRYVAALVAYIHRNPQRHGFVSDFRAWPNSSYRAILSERLTHLQRDVVLDWFNGRSGFEQFHAVGVDESVIGPLVVEGAA